jgi:hypothetical protein
MINFGDVPASSVLPIPFNTFDSNGASITITGLAITDIEIYKGTSMTQRSSDAGYVLMDTDGIDLDGITGIQGFSVDLGDNTDAGFFVAGSFYWVVVSAITVDTRTVNFIAATFRIVAAESIAGTPKTDLAALGGVAQSATDLKDFADDGYDPSTNKVQGVVLVDTVTTLTNLPTIPANWLTAAGTAADFGTEVGTAVWASATRALTTLAGLTVDTVTTLTNLPAITANWLTAAGTAADFTTEIQAGLATQALLTTVAGYIDTEIQTILTNIAALQSDTDNIQTRLPAALTAGGMLKASIEEIQGLTTYVTTGWIGCAVIPTGIDSSSFSAGAINAAALAADAGTEIATAVWASGTRTLTTLSGLTVDTVTTLTNLPAITANWLTAAGTAADFTTEIQSGLATQALLTTVAGYIDTEIQTIITNIAALPTAAVNADAVLDEVVLGSYTMRQLIRLMAAALGGKASGGGTTNMVYRSADDTKNVIDATVDADGNRSAVTLDLT